MTSSNESSSTIEKFPTGTRIAANIETNLWFIMKVHLYQYFIMVN